MYKVLDKVNSSDDVKQLNIDELPALCSDIRRFLVDNISKTGGHLSSNLGIVELTVAINRIYNPGKDRIIFDVGHQSYVHKILTGRKSEFPTLRQMGGLSGFLRPEESKYDAFISGHASTSISSALGMAKARTLLHQDYDVVAVIGDGALTGGLAYEGLCNAAQSKEPMVIILNDNDMSISRNVGGTEKLLQSMRVRPEYIRFKKIYRSALAPFPKLYDFNHELKEKLKSSIISANVFTGMGFNYLGPIDGHDIGKVTSALLLARDLRCPVVLHVITKKGKGVNFAELEPDKYHGIGKFDPLTGETTAAEKTFSDAFGEALSICADKDKRICAITAAMTSGTGLSSFCRNYPDRFFDVGIAEEHGVVMAAGMAKQGLLPVFAVYSSFLQRAFDMLLHDIALSRLHVVFAVDRAGFVGRDGETHQGTFDVAYLGIVPGMKIYCPSSFSELATMLTSALYDDTGPVAVRYPRGGEGDYKDCTNEKEKILKPGTDVTVISYGELINEALAAATELEKNGISAEVCKIGFIDAGAFPVCTHSISKTHAFITVEDVCSRGCVGETIVRSCADENIPYSTYKLLNAGTGIVEQGSIAELRKKYSIDKDGIIKTVKELKLTQNEQSKT